MYALPTAYTGFAVVDMSPQGVNSNTFYLDNIRLIAYEYDYGAHIVDSCGQSVTVPFTVGYTGGMFIVRLLYKKHI